MKWSRKLDRCGALKALKAAVVTGAHAQYEPLVAAALAAGATDQDIDDLVHEVLRTLLLNAEQPITARDLADFLPAAGGNGGQDCPEIALWAEFVEP